MEENQMRWLLVLLATIAMSFGPAAPLTLAADSGSWVLEPIGAPLGTGKVVIELTIEVNGKPVTKTVTIPEGAIKPVEKPKQMQGESLKDYTQRVADAYGEASQAKAKVYADAINEAFKDEFAKLKEKAGTGLKVTDKSYKNATGYIPKVMAPYGSLTIPGVSKAQGNPIKWTENKVIGEGGNGGKFTPGAGPSPGSRGSLGRPAGDGIQVATGVDPLGDPSYVDFGIGQVDVTLFPTPSMTDTQVLSSLALMLDQQGIPATFDPIKTTLFLDQPIPDGQMLNFGNTDTGLEFTMTFEPQVSAVPEPGTIVSLGIGTLCFMGYTYWKRRRNGRGNLCNSE
jgi:hypothetical protein